MALFNKFFFSSSSKKKNNFNTKQSNFSPHFPFDSKQIRVLLYRECDASGRRLLFDSNSIQEVVINENQKQNIKPNLQKNKKKLVDNLNNQTIKNDNFLNDGNYIEISNGIGYKHARPTASDITNIGEMVFGALAMSFRSPSLKVHWLQTPSRLLCSQVFLSPVPGTNTGCLLNQTHLLGNVSNSNNDLSPRQKLKKESSESFDGYSVSSSAAPYSPIETNCNLNMQLSTLPIINDTNVIQSPLNLQYDQIGINKANTQSIDDTTPITIGSDSGYATISDCWTSRSSYQYSTRSSMGSVLSDPLSTYDSLRKLSLDSGKSNYGDYGAVNNNFGSASFSMSTQPKASDRNISRRIARNMQTSFENRNSICDLVGFICDNYQIPATSSSSSDGCVVTKYNIPRSINTHESHSSPEIHNNKDPIFNSSMFNLFGVSNKTPQCKGRKINSKRSKLGLALCISMTETHEQEMEEFCCEHIALLESMLSRLRASAEYAYLNHKRFLKIMLHAWQKTVEWMLDFFTVPRLTIPIWYSLSSTETKASKQITDNFIKEFTWLLKTLDSKDTNFFVSTMITAVLTYHLGWVATVTSMPSHSINLSSDTVTEIINEKQNNLKNTADQYPYNPLWAQMCDLYGAIGNPPKVSRTIVSGKDKNLMEKFLHVLTYFIRCGEIHRNDLNTKWKFDSFKQIHIETETKVNDNVEKPKKKLGLCRKTTCHKNLSEICVDNNNLQAKSNKTNYIPNASTSQKSKFGKKDLHFDFHNSKIDSNITCKNSESQEKIKLIVTTPEDVEFSLDDEAFSIYSYNTNLTDDCEALEAIEIQDSSEINIIGKLEPPSLKEKLNFWNLEPKIKEGISWVDVTRSQKSIKVEEGYYEVINSTNLHVVTENNKRNCVHGKASIPQENKNISLSKLITENSVGKSGRFVWGIEPVKESVCLEEEKHFEISQQLVVKDQNNFMNSKNEIVNQEKGKGVLFVLGENEHLVNIKKSNENLTVEEKIPKNTTSVSNHIKKQSGVKFNLEEYSESVNNFLNKKINFEKSKNEFEQRILKTEKPLNYDFWTKCTCDSNNHTPSSSSTFDLNKNKSENYLKNEKTSSNACEFCKTSNGEEVKTNDKNKHALYDEKRREVCEKIKSPGGSLKTSGSSSIKKLELNDENINCLPISSRGLHLKKMFQNLKEKNKRLENLDFKILPMPETENSNEELSYINNDKINKLKKTGFITSLFIGVTDRYIPDMVLQGTLSPFSMWETNIKNDLTIASHCASLISQPTENIAIIADMEKWEIKILSSQGNNLPYTSSSNSSVGMSQLVSQLLEGFYILSNSGVSSYECFTYLDSKLKEIYLQSEALAGLLLTTEFCSLNSVTTALNLSENDVPLLLAIASIHSPQVTKRYGISFG